MIEIVRAEEKHMADIGKLWWEFILFHQDIDPIYTSLEGAIPGFIENHLQRCMKSDDGLVLVAVDGTKVVGYSLSEVHRISPGLKREKYGYIDDMAVTASYRRKGIGEKMVAEIIKWFQAKDIKRVELGTTAKNMVANSFWQKQGFTVYRYTLYKEIK
jgi:ribosomal protein S18 acetylase RimI-like enzyme